MGYRQIIIKKSERLTFHDNQLFVEKDHISTKVPLEDINFVLIEDSTTIITTRLLSELGKNAIALIVCDNKYQPTSIMLPYNYHYKQLEIFDKQIKQSLTYKNYLWKLIVERKLENEILLLETKINDINVIEKLKEYLGQIELGDSTNREGLAAKIYFRSLFGSKFIRNYDDGINFALNYGYTIIHSCILRNLSVFGLNTYLGIHHCSKTNNFNLASDFIEPYRAIVDRYVYEHQEEYTDELSFDQRKSLVNLLNDVVLVDGKKVTVEYSIELLIKSYVRSLDNGEIKLNLPKIC